MHHYILRFHLPNTNCKEIIPCMKTIMDNIMLRNYKQIHLEFNFNFLISKEIVENLQNKVFLHKVKIYLSLNYSEYSHYLLYLFPNNLLLLLEIFIVSQNLAKNSTCDPLVDFSLARRYH